MSFDEMKALARRSLEMWASGNDDAPGEVFAPGYVNHQEPAAEGGVTSFSLAEWKDIVAGSRHAFSDFEVAILTQLAEGDLVATRWRFAATQTGPYLGHPASGKRAVWTGIQIDQFENGKIVESWVDWDKYRLFNMLGILP